MRRTILAVAAVLALALGATAGAQSPAVTVTPSSGNQFQSFTLTGRDFPPGATLTVAFTSPLGEEFVYYQGADPALIAVGPEGRFTVIVVPAVDFAGGTAGRWRASFCATDAGGCWTAEFAISQ